MPHTNRSPAQIRRVFGENLRKLSGRYPSVSELSRQLGVNRTQFNRYLSGESFPRPDVLYRICCFFGVDARILLEPVETIEDQPDAVTGGFLNDFLGHGIRTLSEDHFPSGFYRFSRRSFIEDEVFIVGLVHVFREDNSTFVRGFEAREAMRRQDLPLSSEAREFRGLVSRQEDGVALMISRRGAQTNSFNFLTRVPSFDNNFWLGYVTRTMREEVSGTRAQRMVYEYLGRFGPRVLSAARVTGYKSEAELMPFHRKLLRPGEPFH